MSKERIWLLLSRKDSGDITPEERDELAELLRDDEPVSAANALLEEVWKRDFMPLEGLSDVEASWDRIQRGMLAENGLEGRRKIFAFNKLLVAAGISVLVACVLGASLYWGVRTNRGNPLGGSINQVSTQLGSRSKIILPDGTKVWLNAGSKLSYGDIKDSSTRAVNLIGEAYFEVAHDPSHPFVVHTDYMDIRDIGTSFSVKYYPGDRQFEATLIEGSIEITNPKDPERKILLKPKEKIIVPVLADAQESKNPNPQDGDESTLYTIAKVKATQQGLFPETAWVHNELVFDNELFKELAIRMERWYNVKIYFSDTAIAATRFSGIITNETVDQALQAMKYSVPFSYQIRNNQIWINKR